MACWWRYIGRAHLGNTRIISDGRPGTTTLAYYLQPNQTAHSTVARPVWTGEPCDEAGIHIMSTNSRGWATETTFPTRNPRGSASCALTPVRRWSLTSTTTTVPPAAERGMHMFLRRPPVRKHEAGVGATPARSSHLFIKFMSNLGGHRPPVRHVDCVRNHLACLPCFSVPVCG